MNALKQQLEAIIQNLDIIYAKRSERDWQCHWKNDETLKHSLQELKSSAKLMAAISVKTTMLATKYKSEDGSALESICEELSTQVNAFFGRHLAAIESSVSLPMFDLLTKLDRSAFVHLTELLSVISPSENSSNANSATEMVWQVCEDIQNLPITNKAAYRRSAMEKLSIIKETIQEFDEYLKIVKVDDAETEGQAEPDADDNEEQDDEFDEFSFGDHIGYNSSESIEATATLQVIRDCEAVLKLLLQWITTVADTPKQCAEHDAACEFWVAHMSLYFTKLHDAVLDLGSELYPPLDFGEDSALMQYKQHLFRLLHQLLNDACGAQIMSFVDQTSDIYKELQLHLSNYTTAIAIDVTPTLSANTVTSDK